MPKPTYAIYHADCWVAVYKDGVKIHEGHEVSNYDLGRILDAKVVEDQDWADEHGGFPQNESEMSA